MIRVLNYLSLIVLFTFQIFLIIIFYWLLYPYNIIKFNTNTFKVVEHSVKQGKTLHYMVDYCKYEDVSGAVSRSFVNGIILTTPTMITNRQTGCHKIKVGAVIPPELDIGEYHMQIIYQYKVNPIRTITVVKNTDKFEVIQ